MHGTTSSTASERSVTEGPSDRDVETPKLSPATRRQIRLQIFLPLLLGVVVIAGLALAIYAAGFGGVGVWADISLVVLILPMMLIGLLAWILTSAVLYVMLKVGGWVLPPLRKAQSYVDQANRMTRRGMDITARPLIVLHGVWAGLARIVRGLRISERESEG
jgi:hypothetical protein